MQEGFVYPKPTAVKATLIPTALPLVSEPAYPRPVPRMEEYARRIAVVLEVVKKKYQVWFVPAYISRSAEMMALPTQTTAKPNLQELPLPAPDNAHAQKPAS